MEDDAQVPASSVADISVSNAVVFERKKPGHSAEGTFT